MQCADEMKTLCVLLPLLFLATAAHAGVDCKNLVSQNDMTQCAEDDYTTADKAMNKAYQHLMSTLGEESRKAKLRSAQRAWIAFRDAECTFDSSAMEGGSGEPMLFAGCVAEETRKRTKALIDALND
jgi:uncharacterized protein YecT (DUF1311 family)